MCSVFFVGMVLSVLSVGLLPFCKTPLTVGSVLFLYVSFVGLSVLLKSGGWLAALMMLVFLSGIMVIFAYFIALDLGEKMFSNYGFFLGALMAGFSINLYSGSVDMSKAFENLENLVSMYSSSGVYLLCFLGLIMFMLMILVVKLSQRSSGPLRGFF